MMSWHRRLANTEFETGGEFLFLCYETRGLLRLFLGVFKLRFMTPQDFYFLLFLWL
jgi:hypothetical protein